MTRAERKAREDAWWGKQNERKVQKEKIMADYRALSYRDKLLFRAMVDFMLDNPSSGADN